MASVAEIWRNPIKGHSREAITSIGLTAGQTLPWDRRWAVAHAAAKASADAWSPCANFSRGSKAPGLMAISSTSDIAAGTVTLRHPDLDDITLDPDRDGDALIAWAAPLMPEGRAASARVIRVPGRGMTDTDYPSVSIGNLASLGALGQQMGQQIEARRFRMNFWLEGLEPWEEFNWVGRQIRLGSAVIEIRERTVRCRATMANPETGRIDADTLNALRDGWGHQDFGVYGVVVADGRVAIGDGAGPLA